MVDKTTLPKLAVWKFASCDGCQLSLLNVEDELLTLGNAITIAHFPEASSQSIAGPYDLSLVEGSISTPDDLDTIKKIRAQTKVLVTIGACATAGGIQALRNYASISEYLNVVYARPEYIKSLALVTPISQHVAVDFELRGCPINKQQLREVISAFLNKRRPNIPSYCVCLECKQNQITCLIVAKDQACLGPITHAGCNALCPRYERACFGCYGPTTNPGVTALKQNLANRGHSERNLHHLLHSYTTQKSRDNRWHD